MKNVIAIESGECKHCGGVIEAGSPVTVVLSHNTYPATELTMHIECYDLFRRVMQGPKISEKVYGRVCCDLNHNTYHAMVK